MKLPSAQALPLFISPLEEQMTILAYHGKEKHILQEAVRK
jgi:hypothetical protein